MSLGRDGQSHVIIIIFIVLIGAFLSIFQIDSKRRRAESVEACCQWALLNVQIIAPLFPFTVQKYMYPPVSRVAAGSFRVSVIHRTLTWTAGFLTCVRDYSYACVFTRGLGTPTASQHNVLDLEKLSQFVIVLLTLAGFEPPFFWIFGSRIQRSTH